MAAIGKIRKHSGLLIIMIGGAMAAFVLGDLGKSFFQPDRQQARVIGTIYDQKIDRAVFERRVEKRISIREQNSGEKIGNEQRRRIRDQVWNDMVREAILNKKVKPTGLTVPKAEVKDLIQGANIHPEIRNNQLFQNERGQFDRRRVVQYIRQAKQDPQAWQQWKNFEQGLPNERLLNKYKNFISKGLYVPKVIAEHETKLEERTFDIEFVVQRYADIPDTAVEYSDSDIRSYYEEHKDDPQYQRERSRSFEYLVFEASPTKTDLANFRAEMEGMAEEFTEVKRDSLFASNNTDAEPPVTTFYQKGDILNARIDSLLMNAQVDSVVGPYRKGDAFHMHKVKGVDVMPDSARVRHIFLRARRPGDFDSLRGVADSLRSVIREEGNFSEMAAQHSNDRGQQGTASRGGSLGWITPSYQRFGRAFADTCLKSATGTMIVVRSPIGVHLVDLMEHTDPTRIVRALDLEKKIRPSKATLDSVYKAASKFTMQYDTPEEFEKGIEEKGYRKQLASKVKEDDPGIARLEDSRKLVRWAFKNEEGTISEQPQRCGDKFVVCHLTKVTKEGPADLEDVRDQIVREVIKKKKAEKYKAIMKGSENLQAAASKIDASVQEATGLSFSNTTIPGVGSNEGKVIGKVATLDEGYMSKPIEGRLGVYVVLLKNVNEPGDSRAKVAATMRQLNRELRSRVDFQLFNTLKEEADIEDNRYQFY